MAYNVSTNDLFWQRCVRARMAPRQLEWDARADRHYLRRYLREDLGREPTDQELNDMIARFGG